MIHGLEKWISLEDSEAELDIEETPEDDESTVESINESENGNVTELEEDDKKSESEEDFDDGSEEEEDDSEEASEVEDEEGIDSTEDPVINEDSTVDEEVELPEQFVTFEPLSEDDKVLAVVNVVEDIDSLESIKEVLQTSSKVSIQTLKALRPTLEAYKAKYGLNGSTVSLEEFPMPTGHSPRDMVEQVSTDPILDQVDKLQNELILNKVNVIDDMLIHIKNTLISFKDQLFKINKSARDLQEQAKKQALLDKPKNVTVTVPVMTGKDSGEVLQRKYNRDHIGRLISELNERLAILEIATECIYVDDPESFLPKIDKGTIAFEEHCDEVNRDLTKQTFEVSNISIIFKRLESLSSYDIHALLEDVQNRIERIRVNVSRVENPKDLQLLNSVILKLSNGNYFRQPLNRLKNELIEICDMFNTTRCELNEYIKSPENISIESLADAPANYWPTSEIEFFHNKCQDGSWKIDKWIKDVHVSGQPVDMVNIVGLKNRYESLLSLVTYNILSDQRSPQVEELKKLVERLKGCIGSVDMDNLEDSLRENIRYLMDFKLDSLPKLPASTNIPMVIEQTTLAPLSEGEFSKMLERAINTAYHVRAYLESITDYDLVEHLYSFNGNEVKCEFKVDLFGEHKENPLVVQYVALINKHVNGLINGILVQRQDFLKQVGVLLQGIRTYLETQIRNA